MPLTLPTLEASLQALENQDRPSPEKADFLKQEARILMETRQISADTWSSLLMRFSRVKKGRGEDAT